MGMSSQISSVTLACLLPARNCAADLAGSFESVARFADAVVALDDGSTDDTAEQLAARARNAGLRIARGRYVTFPGSHIELLPGSLAARVAAHRLGYGLVAGTMVNGT